MERLSSNTAHDMPPQRPVAPTPPEHKEGVVVPRRGLAALVRIRPLPILDSKNKLALLWSAKSGCTFAIKWMFNHMGLLEEALAYDSWIHKYRIALLSRSDHHEASVEDFCKLPSSFRVVRFVRQPFKRAVSSYVHALRNGYEDAQIAAFLARGVDTTSRFSFREFVKYLESLDLRNCNIHHRIQTHPLERRFMPTSGFLVNLDHSMESLPKLESYLGLPQTDPWRYRESDHHTRTSADVSAQFCGDHLFDFTREIAPVLPDYRSFYDSDLENGVYKLYAEDFLKYGFSTTLNGRSDQRV